MPSSTIKHIQKRKPGRPATGQNPVVMIRMTSELIDALDTWAAKARLSRSSAARQLNRGMPEEAAQGEGQGLTWLAYGIGGARRAEQRRGQWRSDFFCYCCYWPLWLPAVHQNHALGTALASAFPDPRFDSLAPQSA